MRGARIPTTLLVSALTLVACGGDDTASSSDAGHDALAADAPLDASDAAPQDASADASDAGLCDPVIKGTCSLTGGVKCALVLGSDAKAVLTCTTTEGPKTDGQDCVRDMGQFGLDNCGEALFCTSLGILQPGGTPTSYACRKYCSVSADCDGSEMCRNLTVPAHYGYCVPACTAFGADCGMLGDCSDVSTGDGSSYTISCRSPGKKALGAACLNNAECAAGLACDLLKCSALCDGAHPCAAGSCTPYAGLSGTGVCH